jgi:hypothetical protein
LVVITAQAAAHLSRRRLLSVSGVTAVGAAGLIAGCGGAGSPRGQVRTLPPPGRHQDIEILDRLLGLEQAAVAAYTAGIPLLRGGAQLAATQFLEQELSHASELSGLVKAAGGRARLPQASYDLGQPRTARDVVRLLHVAERAQLIAYLDAIPRLAPGAVRAAAAAIFANDAQHIAVLRSALGLAPLSGPFVTGRE